MRKEREEIKLIEGEVFRDFRGEIFSLNKFEFDSVRRMYTIHHPDVTIVRGWNGHRHERKWFHCIKGKWIVAIVKIDDFENPSLNLKADVFKLTDSESSMICVPEGYANAIKALEENSIIQVFSDKSLHESESDSWRYPSRLWVNWEKFK